MAGLLSNKIVDVLAHVGTWDFEVQFNDVSRDDDAVYSVEGVAGVDEIKKLLTDNPQFTARINVTLEPLGVGYSKVMKVNQEDLDNLRARFIEVYGDVDKVPIYPPDDSVFPT